MFSSSSIFINILVYFPYFVSHIARYAPFSILIFKILTKLNDEKGLNHFY